MADGAVFDVGTARWLVGLGKKLDSSQILNPGHIERLVLKVMPRLGGDGSSKYAYPPTGGIPAATYNSTTKVLIPGTANCTLAERTGNQYDDTGETILVENVVGAIVGSSGKPMVIARTSYGKWVVIVEDCTGTSGPVASSSILPDPGDGGGSRGIDPGYSMDV